MKLKNILFFILFLLAAHSLSAQEDRKALNDSLRKQPFLKRLTYSMGGGLSGSTNGTSISLQPQVGYKIRTNIIAGVGLNYQYYKSSNFNFQSYGGNAFTRYIISQRLFTQLEYQLLNYSYRTSASWNDYLMIGGGYTPGTGLFVSAYYLLKYPANNNIYGEIPFVFRVGFNF